MFTVRRDPHNPFINPNLGMSWSNAGTFNPSPVEVDGKTWVLYRAQSQAALYHDNEVELSVIGSAQVGADGKASEGASFIAPSEPYDWYGCEDPRMTYFEGQYLIFYTAISDFPFRPDGIRVAIAVSDDLKTVKAKHLVTPFNAKAMTIFPERIDGKIYAILTVHSDQPPASIVVVAFDNLEQIWSQEFWNEWYQDYQKDELKLNRSESDHVEVGASPILTDEGWLLVYSHIENYYTDNKLFGIEAVLLDKQHPRKLVKRTSYPFMIPEESYERYGRLPNIIFPSGATLKKDRLTVYYGATDQSCCRASLSLSSLIACMTDNDQPVQHAKRYEGNPILSPIAEHPWESVHVFNPAAIELGGKIHILYRAFGPDNVSRMGHAVSLDGVTISEREDKPIYEPRADFELAATPGILSGCEDMRIVEIDDRLYITYTAYNGVDLPHVALASIATDDFIHERWDKWDMPHLISPVGIDDKDAAVLQKSIHGKYLVFHRINGYVCADYVDTLDFTHEHLTRCIQVIGPRQGMWDSKKIGIAGPAVPSPQGWILFYHGISELGEYCLGAALLDNNDPTAVIGRTAYPIMTPVEAWEREGWIPNVVFPCGQIERDGLIYLYYGGADHVVGVATINKQELISSLLS